MQRARGDEHLLGRGRGAAGGQVSGDRGAQHGQARRVVARAGQVAWEFGGGGGERGVQHALGRRAGRAAEVDHVRAGRPRNRREARVRRELRP